MSRIALDEARAWAADDPDPQTRAELLGTIEQAEGGNEDARRELADAFAGPLEFGTAGLRGRLGPGPNRMNLVVVARAAAGLARYLGARGGGSVVIGYDTRRNSDLFARTTAQILSGAGLHAMVLPSALPTPVLAFAIRHLGAQAGIMVTASHNPPEDNGYKVYLADGSQIASPADSEISAHIAAATAVGPVADLPHGDTWITLDDGIVDDYARRAVSLLEDAPLHTLRIAYTPLHGVGGALLLGVLKDAGFPRPVVVDEQFEPDGSFPTVAFPNPEEPGAMDLVFARAEAEQVDLVLANDPDADRLAVGVRGADGWQMLSGDEVGWLLAWWIGSGNRRLTRRGVFAQSLVSGSMLEPIARDFQLEYEQTLTGFKWIGRVPELMYGYEEALGYCVDPLAVRDKDGITAALLFAEMASRLQRMGRTVLEMLDDLARTYGVHGTRQVSVRVLDVGRVAEVMAELRSNPPDEVGGLGVERCEDLSLGLDSLPPTDGLRFTLARGSRVIVRPSGTEPKVKAYLQSIVAVEGGSLDDARRQADERLRAMAADVTRWLG